MDTLNPHIETTSTISTSETHSEKTASDEEDFKSTIPYFDEANNRILSTQASNYETRPQNMEEHDNDDDPANFNYQNWDNDDSSYIDDNMSRVGSDYSAYSGNENMTFYTPPGAAGASGSTDPTRAMMYSPNEMILRPPASSSLSYNYPHVRRHAQPPSHMAQPHPFEHPPYGPYPNPGAGSSGAFNHRNMWYPNAPCAAGGYYQPYASHRYSQYNSGYSHDPMMDMLQLSNSGREARNRAEKNRRDKLNGSIQELSTMVPHVAESPRRVDKTAVLRFATHGMRLNYVFGDTLNQPRPQITDTLMKLLDSFLLTLTCHGQIVLITSSIEQHLGHCQADLLGQNILHITHPEDHNMLKQALIPTDLENLFDVQTDDEASEPRSRTQAEEEHIDRALREDKRSFTVRFARAGPRSEPTTYEVVKIDGSFRRSDAAPRGVKTSTFPSSLQLIRRTRGREDAIPLHTISGNDIVLIAIARIVRPPKIINRVMEATNLEYKTRHLIDGRIIDCDQRIGIVAGYMTDEVRNLSPFTFMHQDDVRWVIVALRQMYDCNSSYGESTYRLLTRNGNFIYLQSKGYLEIDKETNQVHSFVCINSLLDEEEGKRRVQEMKNKFSIIINTKITQTSIDVPASENPLQLEKAVMCLIQNLHKSSDDEDVDASPSSYSGCSSAAHADSLRALGSSLPHLMKQSTHTRNMSACSVRSTKTPPLALVPPEASSVKNSISKSVSVVNVTAAKHLRGNQRVRSPLAGMDDCETTRYDLDLRTQHLVCTCQATGEGDCEYCQLAISRVSAIPSPSCMKRSISCSDSEDVNMPKRLKSTDVPEEEIKHALSGTLIQLHRSLHQQYNAVKDLRDQSSKYEVPDSNRIDEIMEEHQKQSEIYVNIKSEYEDQIQNQINDANTTNSSDPQDAE